MSIWGRLFRRQSRQAPAPRAFRPALESLELRDVPAFLPLTPLSLTGTFPSGPISNNLSGFAATPGFGGSGFIQTPGAFGTNLNNFQLTPQVTPPPTQQFSNPGFANNQFLTNQSLGGFGTGLTPGTVSFPAAAPSPFLGAAGSPALNNLVNSLFVGLLGRPADAGGLASTVANLSGGLPLVTVTQGIAFSNEALTIQVTRFYTELLNRAPDAAGLASNVQLLRQAGQGAVITNFLTSPEFLGLNGGGDAAVAGVFEGLLQRQAGPNELASFRGVPLANVVNSVRLSPEFNLAGIDTAFQAFLGRTPDPTGLQGLLPTLQTGRMDFNGLAVSLIVSPEFQGRFGF